MVLVDGGGGGMRGGGIIGPLSGYRGTKRGGILLPEIMRARCVLCGRSIEVK